MIQSEICIFLFSVQITISVIFVTLTTRLGNIGFIPRVIEKTYLWQLNLIKICTINMFKDE
jgi:hypothetical protein